MDNNYHIFVVITTIIVYIFLSSKKKESNDETSNIMYLLYVPAILYGGYYFFYSTPTKPETLGSNISSDVVPSVKEISIAPISQQIDNIGYVPSDDLLSDPYPSSTNSNF
jgi:hypothetical protein